MQIKIYNLNTRQLKYVHIRRLNNNKAWKKILHLTTLPPNPCLMQVV